MVERVAQCWAKGQSWPESRAELGLAVTASSIHPPWDAGPPCPEELPLQLPRFTVEEMQLHVVAGKMGSILRCWGRRVYSLCKGAKGVESGQVIQSGFGSQRGGRYSNVLIGRF